MTALTAFSMSVSVGRSSAGARACREAEREDEEREDREQHHERDGATEGPVEETHALLVDEGGHQLDAGSADQAGGDERAYRQREHQHAAGHDAGQHEGQRDLEKGLQRRSAGGLM